MKKMGLKQISIVVLIIAITPLLIVEECLALASQGQGAKILAEVQLRGLAILKDCNATLSLTLNNITKTQSITFKQGEELKVLASVEAPLLDRSLLQIQLKAKDSELFRLKMLFEGVRARVVEADYNNSLINPLEHRELLNVKLTTSIARIKIFLPIALADERMRVEARIGGREAEVKAEKTSNGTIVTLTSMISLNETPHFHANISSGNLTIVELSGRIASENSSDVAVKGLVKTVQVEVLRGYGVLALSLPTSILLSRTLDDKGILYRGVKITLEPIASAERVSREVKLMVIDKVTMKVIEKPILLVVKIPAYQTSFNISAQRGEILLSLPREPAKLSIFAEGYKSSAVEIQVNTTELRVSLDPLELTPLQKAMLALRGIALWVSSNWPVLIAMSLIALVISLVVGRR